MDFNIVCLGFLQSGSHGDLILGQRSDTGEQVVIKYLRDAHLMHARKVFEREVRILSLNLPGLVPLLESNLRTHRPYYVMPYLGGTLKSHAGKLNVDQLRAVARELATTLAALHAKRIFHGDIKPDNVLIGWDGHLQVADPLGNGLGCTMFFSANRGGTPGYWAPEIRAGLPIHPAGDVYSLGAMLYELATGQMPRDDQDLDPGLWADPKIREIIVACCNKNPLLRPTMEDILRLLGGEQWEHILIKRQQNQEVVATCILSGLAVASIFLLFKGRRNA